MKEFRKILSLLLILALIIPGMAFANEPEESINNPETEFLDLTHDERIELDKIKELINSFDSADRKKIDIDNTEYDNKPVRIIVELKDKPVISYATQYGISYSTMAESDIDAIEDNILNVQESIKRDISNRRIDFKIDKSFTTIFNGFSGEAEYKDIERIENVPGVKKVYISQEYERPDIKPEMNSSNEMVRSLSTWELGYKGEGMVVAVIDTGIDPSHKDMVLSDGTTPSLTEQIVLDTGLEGKYYTEKVPYGYNYYDLNHEILDLGPGASEHGMHVAGTVGANGDPENGGIKGVAPEAQLLAMKVFSNDPLYATTFDDIYLAAMEDAIKLNANVLNMSLGSTASFYEPECAVNVAITNAVENGIVCAISAGNSAMFGNMYDLPWKENPDIGVVGAPGLSYDSIQVASIENNELLLPYMEVYIGDEKFEDIAYHNPSPVDPATFFNGEKKEVVYVGTGEPQYYEGKNVEGKVVLAVRTGDFFYSKIQHEAEKHGVAGVIVRGTEGHGDYVNMALDNPSFPVISLSIADGNMLAEKAQAENNISVVFTGEMKSVPNGTAGEMSDFTSWGTTPSLELKPEITAPGGQIYSTLQNDKYGTMSGTSMASPHVAGGAALVSQYIKTTDNFRKVPLNGLLDKNDDEIKLPVLPNSTVIIEDSAFSVEILEGNDERTVNAQKCIVDSRRNNKGVYVKLHTGRIAELSGRIVSDYSEISKTVTYVDASGNEIQYDLSSENSIEEQTKLAKILLMNTSKIVLDEAGKPISPRCQGSGLMDLNSAVTTPCFVVNRANNEAKVELKDFKDTTFTLELRAVNVTDEEVTYNIDVDVLTDYIYKFDGDEKDYNVLQTRPLKHNVILPESITVPAHGAKDFSIIVSFQNDPYIYENMFVEGFVKLTKPEDVLDKYEDLSIPYVGFYGEWDEPAILDGIPELGEESFYGYSGMVNTDGNFMDVFAMSPGTDDGSFFGTDALIPVLSFLRNAEKVQCNILDIEGKHLRTISNEEFVRKNYFDGGRDLPFSYNPNRAWDGKVKGEIVEEGQYIYEVKTKIHYKDAEWQTKQIPIFVDKTPPVLDNVEFDEESKELSFKANDALTGIAGAFVFVNGNDVDMKELKEDEENKGSYSIDLTKDVKDLESIRIEVDVLDYAYNIAYEVLEIGVDVERPELYIETPDLLEVYTDSQIVFTGAVFDTNLAPTVTIGDDVEAVVWFDPNIEIFEPGSDEVKRSGPGYRYQAVLEFADGVQEVSVKVTTNGGNETSLVRRFYVDTIPPELSYEVKEVNEETGKATLTVTMKDNFPVLKLYAFDSEVFSYDGLQEEYLNIEPVEKIVDIEVDLEEGTNVIPLTLVDIGGLICEVTIEREVKTELDTMVEEIEGLILELPEEVTEENKEDVTAKLKIIEEKTIELLTKHGDFDVTTIEGYDKYMRLAEAVKATEEEPVEEPVNSGAGR